MADELNPPGTTTDSRGRRRSLSYRRPRTLRLRRTPPVLPTDRLVYLTLGELVRRHREPAGAVDASPLTPFELRCFSQHGEDGVIAEILRRIGTATRTFVEFGIETGHEGNCVFLADVLDWSGVFIEPDEASYAALERKYAGNPRIVTHRAAVTPDNVEGLFDRLGVADEPDLLSIDVDGADYWIWERLTAYRPRVLVIEYNSALPAGRALVQPAEESEGWQGTDYFGASLDALIHLGRRKDYRFVHSELGGANAFFVRDDLAQGRFPALSDVPRRTEPNYFLAGRRHPPDTSGRTYVDLDG